MQTSNLPPSLASLTSPERAEQLRARGLNIIPLPLRCKIPGAGFTWKHLQKRRVTDQEAQHWFASDTNIAILTGAISGVVVVDTDSPEGEAWVQTNLPETPMQTVTSKGRHRFYRHPGLAVPNKCKLETGDAKIDVDMRGDGGYVLAPGSVHPSGSIYLDDPAWAGELEIPFFDPTWLPVVTERQEGPPAVIRPKGGGRPDGFERARRYVQKVDPAIQGAGGDVKTLTLAAKLVRGFDLPDEQALQLLREWDATCVPSWGEKALRRKIASAHKYCSEPYGGMLGDDKPGSGEPDSAPAEPVFRETDLGNAYHLHALFGQDLRYCHPAKCWFVWSGCHWQRDENGQALYLANLAAQERLRKALEMEPGGKRKRAIAWALQCESRSRRDACLAQAASLPELTIRVEEMDRNPWLLACQNGVVDLRTGKLGPHRREDYCTRLIPVDYDPDAVAPLWEAFLLRILGADGQLLRYVQCAAGYSLTGSTREQVLFILWGGGANGKSTFLETLLAVAGGYGLACKPETFLHRQDAGVRNDLARLRGARLVKSVETSEGKRLDEGLVKQATGGDKIVARFLFQEEFEFAPEFKLWLATNHRPEIRGTDRGIWRRIRLLPFVVEIPPADQDRTLPDQLRAELPGILAWAVRGALDWQRNGLPEVAAVVAATEAYRVDQDHLGRFLVDACVLEPSARVLASELYSAYTAWAQEGGERPWPQRTVSAKLQERGFTRARVHGGRFSYQGIGLALGSPGEPCGEPCEEGSNPYPNSLFGGR